jgi:hypothetical protein
MNRTKPILVCGLLALGASLAYAEPAEQLNLPKGKLLINGFVEINLSKDAAFKPVSITPDIWYGITDDITVGLVHSSIGAGGFIGATGDSLCITGKSNGCGKFYRNVGADLRYRLARPWSIDGGLYIASISDPFLLDLKLGVSGRWKFGKLALEFQPNLFISLNKRSDGADATMTTPAVPPNNERLNLPVTVGYEVATKIEVEGQTGVTFPFAKVGDFFAIPLSLGLRYRLDDHLGFGLAFSLPQLIAGDGLANGFDVRTITLGVSYAL